MQKKIHFVTYCIGLYCFHFFPRYYIYILCIYVYMYICIYMFVCYSRYDKMFRQVIIEMRLGCQKRILYHQNPVPQCHEVTSFQNTMVNTNLGRMLEVFSTGTQNSWLKYTRTTNGDLTEVHTTKSHHLNPATASCIDNNRHVLFFNDRTPFSFFKQSVYLKL